MVTEVSVTCRLCENTFLKPRVVPCCKIKCCYQCLQSLEDDNKGCPVCGTSFKVESLEKCPFIETIIATIKPAVLMSQILDDYAKYPHLQTSVVKREMRNALMGCVEMDEKISFFIKYKPNVAMQSLASSSRSSPSSPPEIERQLQNVDNIKSFNRGYRCLATTPISTIRQMMVQKFQIDESVAKVVFYNSGALLADCITLRTVAFRMNSPQITRMTIDMLLMPKDKPQKPSTSSSIEGVNTEDVKKIESEADKAAEKLEEGPPVLEEETMPSLDAETPQLGQEPTPPPPSVEEAKTDSPTITTIVPLVKTPPKHMPVIGQVVPMQYQPQMHRTPPNLVAQPMVMHRTPPNMIQQPLMKHRAPPNMLQQSTPRCVNVEKLKPLPLTFNQAATSQVVELLFLRAMEKRIEPSKFLECYYSAADGPPLHRKLTPEEKQIYDFRRKCDAQGAFIPTISPENQATLYHQMFDKRIQVMDEERAKKRRSIETAQDGTKRLKKTEVSAYVVSTPIMHKPPPPLPSTPSSSSSTSSVSSLPGPSMIDEKPIIKPKQELPIANVKTEQPSPLATPTNEIDALTLSRQCSKTLGKTLAESMRRSGGNSSKPSFMLPQNPPPTINNTKLVLVDEKPRVGPV